MSDYTYPGPDDELIPGGKWTPPPLPLPNRPDLSLGGVAGQFNPATGGFGAISPQLISALRTMQANPQDQMLLQGAMQDYKPPGSPTDPTDPGRRGPGAGLRGRPGGGMPGGRPDPWSR